MNNVNNVNTVHPDLFVVVEGYSMPSTEASNVQSLVFIPEDFVIQTFYEKLNNLNRIYTTSVFNESTGERAEATVVEFYDRSVVTNVSPRAVLESVVIVGAGG